MAKGGEFCEIYHEYKIQNVLTLEENKIKESKFHVNEGVGIRVVVGEKVGYAYSDIIDEHFLLRAAKTAAYISSEKITQPAAINTISQKEVHSCSYETPNVISPDVKSELLFRVNEAARSNGSEIFQVTCTFFDEMKHVEIANSEGLWKRDEQSVINLNVVCAAQMGTIRDIGRAFEGGRYPFSYLNSEKPEKIGKKAAQQAITKLHAHPAPNTSLYSGKMKKKVASSLVTIIDDGTIPNGRGTLVFDDEGTPTERTVLIENGVLVGLMTDLQNSRLLGIKPTGNGRRMSFREYPLPRMTNTFIDRGDTEESDLIGEVKKGIYAAQLGGGQVDITTGNFVFEVSEGYLIENGKITSPIRGANLIGNGPEAMQKVVGVGNDLKIESAAGTCGKDGQNVYVGVGQPVIYISEMTIGGTG